MKDPTFPHFSSVQQRQSVYNLRLGGLALALTKPASWKANRLASIQREDFYLEIPCHLRRPGPRGWVGDLRVLAHGAD